MAAVERSALLGFTATQMLALVQDVESYPAFLPGCVAATVEAREGARSRARLSFRLKGLSDEFATENELRETEPGLSTLEMRLLRGPFKRLSGQWRFQRLSDDACKVSLAVQLEFGALALEKLFLGSLDRAVGELMSAFKARAETLYG